ncbi:MAG: PAS domain-containing protein [Sulfuriferula multivorans]|uniref:histidine kinase n=1 Tax=Sulfuriferula multivorans TaxID=1559896 RepID=A0A7C9P4M1_9PROT|nr:PAS domain-containing protein [Sulfuriferula multivorans]
MLAYEQVLRGGIALFNASDTVTRQDWHAYISSLEIDKNFPGIQGIGFSRRIPASALDHHIQAIRAEGFADFTVKPAGHRDEYTSIVYLEPFDARNQRAFGFDMFSEPTRRAAMVQARDTGRPATTGKVILKQETSTDVQSGFLMYLPLYAEGAAIDSVAQREQSLIGYVYSPFRMKDLMRGILGQEGRDAEIDLEIYDGDDVSDGSLMYDNDGVIQGRNSDKLRLFSNVGKIDIQGHGWTLVITSTPAFEARIDRAKPTIVALAGIVISFLFFAVVWSLATHRSRALKLAGHMTDAFRRSEERFELAIRGANDGLWDWDIQTNIVYFSPRWKAMLGYAEDEVGDTVEAWNKRIHPDDLGRVEDEVKAYLDGNQAHYQSEYRVRHKEGHFVWILDRGIAQRDAKGKPYRMVGIYTDISQQKKMDRLKSEFVSTVSHELRTPLTSIRGSLGLVAGEVAGELPAQAKALIDIAYSNTERLLTLINDILDIEKIQSGKIDFDFKPQPLMPLVEQAISANTGYAERHNVTFTLVEGLPGVMVNVDGERLRQVMSNLLSNAAKFSHADGKVEVTVSLENQRVRIAVIDHGVGVPDDFRGHIFDKFTQADSSDTRHKGGTGLGLSITKSIVEMMQGAIGFDSTPGVGTTFYFTLPLWHEASET